MIRIFLPLCGISWVLLGTAFVLGLTIENAHVANVAVQRSVNVHFLTALGAVVFATLVHALVLTYFMGTGRWLEETTSAYRLDPQYFAEGKSLKYRVIPALVGAFILLLVTVAFGAAADPGSPVQFAGWFGVSAATTHLIAASIALAVNAAVNYVEVANLYRNGELIERVMQEVRRIRQEKGLAVD